MTRMKAVAYVMTLVAVVASIIAAATFQPRPSDRHFMPASSFDVRDPVGLRPRTGQPYTVLADDLDERIRRGDLGAGGQILDVDVLARLTGRTPAAVRHALRQLLRTGTVEDCGNLARQWCVPDDHSTLRAARRAHALLDAMIAAGGYPSADSLPRAEHLADTLLTGPEAITLALHALTSRNPRPATAAERARVSGPSRTGRRTVSLGADTAWDPHDIHHLRDLAREQWRQRRCPSHHALSHTEALQHDVLHRLTAAACRQGPPTPAVGAALARAAAARDTTVISLGERHWRSAVLAGLLADLADALSAASARPVSRTDPLPAPTPRPGSGGYRRDQALPTPLLSRYRPGPLPPPGTAPAARNRSEGSSR
ncbi:hypothetical protein [Streptomyces californicus]|uniref:hypothetical protein n=1 Tax=Streptomyces californicus TaxID=67351 RepID=UPI0037A77E69